MSPWKSRWSWVRLVNTPTLNRAPWTRSSTRLWLETSAARAASPASAEARSQR